MCQTLFISYIFTIDLDFGEYYYAYRGVPYAKPPVKELRFKVNINFIVFSLLIEIYFNVSSNHNS